MNRNSVVNIPFHSSYTRITIAYDKTYSVNQLLTATKRGLVR